MGLNRPFSKPSLLKTVTPISPSCPNSTLSYCKPSLVYVPGTATGNPNPNSPYLVEPLLLYLPGSGGNPGNNTKILRTAAFAGYRTIGLSYYNKWTIEEQCVDNEVPPLTSCEAVYSNECAYMVRKERLTGVNLAATDQQINVQDSIASRLLTVLGELIAQDLADGVDDWNWDNYCIPEGHGATPGGVPLVDRIVWENIVIAGYSQGAGYPQLISLEREVDGIVSIDGGNDRCGGGASVATYYKTLTSNLANPGGASPGTGEFAIFHDENVWPGMAPPEVVPDSFAYVQLDQTYHNVDTTPMPLTHDVAFTNQRYPVGCESHSSMALDSCITNDTSWNNPVQSQVFSAPTPDKMHLFPAFVKGFCNAN